MCYRPSANVEVTTAQSATPLRMEAKTEPEPAPAAQPEAAEESPEVIEEKANYT